MQSEDPQRPRPAPTGAGGLPSEAGATALSALLDALEAALDGQPLRLPPPTGEGPPDRLRGLLSRLPPLSPPRAPLRALLAELEASAAPRARSRGLSFAFERPSALPAAVAAEGARLSALLDDLVTCAILVTRARGGLRLSAAPSADGPGAGLRLSVEGPGLVMGVPGAMFAEARAIGARLQLPPEQPTLATLELALAPGASWAAAAPLGPQAARAALRGLRVLAVDDHELNRFILSGLLEELGCAALLAADGAAALRLAEAERPDALILDLHMPGLDGLEVARRLRAWEAEAGLPRAPIFALTADEAPATAEACRAAGMDNFLVKPADPDAVLAALVEHFGPGAAAAVARPARLSPPVAAPPASLAADRRRAPEAAPALALDQKQVAMMREVMGPAAFTELVRTFVAHTAEQIDALEAALGARDVQGGQRLAHGIKSGTAQMGATGMSQRARALEDQLRGDQAIDAPAAIRALREGLEAVRGALSA